MSEPLTMERPTRSLKMKKKSGVATAPRTYVNLSADLSKLETKLARQRADVTATEEAVTLTKKALSAELARVK